jgi:hypothetical protein
MAITTYTVQTSVLASGTMTVKLHSDLVDLVVPTFQTLKLDTDFVTRVDIGPGRIELENVQFDYVEDYTVYAEGFWYKVLNSYAEIQLLLNEGSGDTHFYWGRVLKNQTPIEEFDLTVGNIQRRGSIQTMTILGKMKDFTAQEILNDIDAELFLDCLTLDGVGSDNQVIKLSDFMNSFVKTVFNTTFDPLDIALQGFDLKLAEQTYSNLYLLAKVKSSGAWFGLFNTDKWPSTYATAFDLFTAICRSLAVIPRHYYDVANSRHRIELLTRGTSFAYPGTFGVPAQSTFQPSIDEGVNNLTVHAGAAAVLYYSGPDNKSTYTDAPNGFESDMDVTMEWGGVDYVTSILYHDTGTAYKAVLEGEWMYWDYEAGAWSTGYNAEVAMARYLYTRLSQVKRSYSRTYNSLKSTANAVLSHVNTTILMRTSIDDGIASRNFYATEVTKNPDKDECTIQWNEV